MIKLISESNFIVEQSDLKFCFFLDESQRKTSILDFLQSKIKQFCNPVTGPNILILQSTYILQMLHISAISSYKLPVLLASFTTYKYTLQNIRLM